MTRDDIQNEYFEWLYDIACGDRHNLAVSFRKLLIKLHDTEFRYFVSRDENKAIDGMDLRYRYAVMNNYGYLVDEVVELLAGPCSVLEMMVALAIHCEEDIMDDPTYGDRTRQWFWNMVISLGLGAMADYSFDKEYVEKVLERFLNREYAPDGRGGLFTIRHCDQDLRFVEIEFQMLWYLNTIT